MSPPSQNYLRTCIVTGVMWLGWIAASGAIAAAVCGCGGDVPRVTRTSIATPSTRPSPRGTSPPLPTRMPSATRTPTRPRPTITPTRSPTPLPDAVVSADSAYVREGPGSHYAIILICPLGTTLGVLGRSTGGLWLNVRAPEGSLGWVQRGDVHLNKVFKELPTVEAPPF